MSAAEASGAAERPTTVQWSCWATLVMVALVNALAPAEPFPYWSGDPTRIFVPPVGLTPFWTVALDLAGVLAAVVAIGVSRRALLLPAALGLIGALGVSLQALHFRAGAIEDVRLGAAWLAAVLGAVGMAHLCRDERLRRLTLALLIGVVAMLLAKGILQVAIEHPATVERYRHDRAAFLAANGWTPDSPQARMFERRLNQPEASGWFGMSNVFATFAAGAFAALLGWSVLAWVGRIRKEVPDGWAGVLTLGALGAAAAVYLSHSKGGMGAAAVGAGVLGVIAIASRRPALLGLVRRRAGVLALALIGATLAGVALRGLISERLGELSILFRWFYTVGAARAFASHPLLGVGPAGFKDAYMLAKPAISPEEVVSAHSVLWDYAATLGVFGLAWCGVFLWLVWRAGRESLAPVSPAPAEARERGGDGWVVFLVASGATLLAARSEIAAQTGDAAVARFGGLVGWIGIALGALAVMRADPRWRWGAGAGVLAMAVHAQIEVTAFWAGAAPLLLIALGALAAPSEGAARPARPSFSIAPAALLAAIAAWWVAAGLLPVYRWERALTGAAGEVEPFADLIARQADLAGGGGPGSTDSIQALAQDAARLAGTPIPQNEAQFNEAMRLAFLATSERAAARLRPAIDHRPADLQTSEALARLRLMRAQALPDPAARRAEVESALAIAREAAERPTSGSLNVLANTLRAAADLLADEAYRRQAVAVLERADALDPYGLGTPWRLFELSRQLGDPGAAKRWGGVALERDRLQRLDQEARGLTEAQRRQVRAVLDRP